MRKLSLGSYTGLFDTKSNTLNHNYMLSLRINADVLISNLIGTYFLVKFHQIDRLVKREKCRSNFSFLSLSEAQINVDCREKVAAKMSFWHYLKITIFCPISVQQDLRSWPYDFFLPLSSPKMALLSLLSCFLFSA